MTEESNEAWEIDVLEMTLDDLEILQKGLEPGVQITQLKEALGRLVVNKTTEEIGMLTLRELGDRLDAVTVQVEELAVPKENGTPS